MVIAILIALLLSVVIYALATLIVRKLPVGEFAWVVWVVAIILIVVVWWVRVLEPLVGPLP